MCFIQSYKRSRRQRRKRGHSRGSRSRSSSRRRRRRTVTINLNLQEPLKHEQLSRSYSYLGIYYKRLFIKCQLWTRQKAWTQDKSFKTTSFKRCMLKLRIIYPLISFFLDTLLPLNQFPIIVMYIIEFLSISIFFIEAGKCKRKEKQQHKISGPNN